MTARHRPLRPLIALLAGGAMALGPAAASHGWFQATATTTATFTTSTGPASPDTLSVSWVCERHGSHTGWTAVIEWAPAAGADRYQVDRADGGDGPWSDLTSTTATVAREHDVEKKAPRSYRVTPKAGAWSGSPLALTGLHAPSARC